MMSVKKQPVYRVYLVGFSGSGKSTIAPLLAKHLKTRLFDTDSLIEQRTGMTISDIFARKGESYFRKIETTVIRELAATRGPIVVALGGGAFTSPVNRKLITKDGVVVFLSCSVRELYRRTQEAGDRPLLGSKSLNRPEKLNKIKRLLNKRLASYQLADVRVSTSNKTPSEIVRTIITRVKELYARY